MKFLYVFDEINKNKLIKKGYVFIKEVTFENRVAFLFTNNLHETLNFDKQEVFYTNNLMF